jgi:hypothetical protein
MGVQHFRPRREIAFAHEVDHGLHGLTLVDRVGYHAFGPGEPAPVAVPTDNGRPHEIYRCPVCQTALWSDYGGRPALRFVRVGTLDDPTALAPDVHIFTRSKLPWVRLPEGVPAFDVYYDMKALWPAAILARRRAILC